MCSSSQRELELWSLVLVETERRFLPETVMACRAQWILADCDRVFAISFSKRPLLRPFLRLASDCH